MEINPGYIESTEKVRRFYDLVAKEYADHFYDELSKKHMDRVLLSAFATRKEGLMADFGCGPGQTTRYLKDCGIKDILGIDLSPEVIDNAKNLNPDLKFETGNILELGYPNEHFSSAIAFYTIVHFTKKELQTALNEIFRVLKKKGEFLFSYHIGTEVIHHDEFFSHKVDIEFRFFETETVLEIARETGFSVVDAIERYPYPEVEYPSKRAYIWLVK